MGQIELQLAGKAIEQRGANVSLELWPADTAKIDPKGICIGHQLYFQSLPSQKTSIFVIPELVPPFFFSLLSEQFQIFGHDLDEPSPCFSSGECKSPVDIYMTFQSICKTPGVRDISYKIAR